MQRISDVMKKWTDKIIPALIITFLTTTTTAWFNNSRQLEENRNAIVKLSEDLEKVEKSHTRRLENIEHYQSSLPDNYITRREFNVIIASLNEKMNKVDKNVEKLLDMKMKDD